MGQRGPAPTPKNILAARGSWRADSNDRRDEPEDALAAPEPPPGLSERAIEHWNWIVPKLLQRGTIAEIYLGLLVAMCVEYGEYLEAVDDLAKMKREEEGWANGSVEHPRTRMRQSFERYSKCAREFGLSPAAKARVTPEARPQATQPAAVERKTLRIAQ